jgi:hypothetical protein
MHALGEATISGPDFRLARPRFQFKNLKCLFDAHFTGHGVTPSFWFLTLLLFLLLALTSLGLLTLAPHPPQRHAPRSRGRLLPGLAVGPSGAGELLGHLREAFAFDKGIAEIEESFATRLSDPLLKEKHCDPRIYNPPSDIKRVVAASGKPPPEGAAQRGLQDAAYQRLRQRKSVPRSGRDRVPPSSAGEPARKSNAP